MPTLAQLVHRSRTTLEAADISPAESEMGAELLLRHLLGWTRADYLEHARDEAPAGLADRLEPLVAERARHTPLQYITGSQEFWSLTFEVTRAVLIPRPETELIVELVAAAVRRERIAGPRIADVGTGSACIAVALAHELPDARVDATDHSAAALAVAARNARRHGVHQRVRFLRGNLLEPLRAAGPRAFDFIVANPPYIAEPDFDQLPPEVRCHEPREALVAGPDGLEAFRHIVPAAAECLKFGGYLMFEIGFGQQDEVRELVGRSGEFDPPIVHTDLQGIPRTLVARRC